jgi:hypothetical protein
MTTQARGVSTNLADTRGTNYTHVMSTLPPSTLFYIERSIDTDIVVYEAVRVGNTLQAPYVASYHTTSERPTVRTTLAATPLASLLECMVHKEGPRYKMALAVLPSRTLSLHIRKVPGVVHAKTKLHHTECRLLKIYIEMTQQFGIPTGITSVTAYGQQDQLFFTEEIPVAQLALPSFDLASLFTGFY